MYCERCKKSYASDENFCAECGSKLVDELDVYAKELLNKDESAFDRIYNNTKTWVSRYVSMHLGNQDDCMDCTQEIYFKLFNKIDLFQPENGKFRPWFNTLVKNQVIDFARKNSKDVLIDDEEVFESIVDPEPIAEIEMDRKESARLLNEILDTLPEEQKICIKGFYFEGKKRKEIAELLGLSEETIKSRLRLAKEKIEAKVLDLERMQGTRIYGLSPFAFFLFLGAGEKTEGMDLALLQGRIWEQKEIAKQISRDVTCMNNAGERVAETMKTVASQTVTANIPTATVGKATATIVGKAVFSKGIATVLTAVLIGGSGFAVYKVYEKQKENPKNIVTDGKVNDKTSDKELETLVENIDMEYLEGALLLLPEFMDKEEISEAQICNMAQMATTAKDANERIKQDFYLTANVIDDQKVIKVSTEETGEYYPGYILLKKDAFNSLFEMFGKKFDENILFENVAEFIQEEGNIKYLLNPVLEADGIYSVKDVKLIIDSSNQRIKIEYKNERQTWDDEGTPIVEEQEYIACLLPSDNSLGYVIQSNEKKEDALERMEEEEIKNSVSVKELKEISDSMDMNLVKMVLSNCWIDEEGKISSFEWVIPEIAFDLYTYREEVEENKEIFEAVEKEIVIGKDMEGYEFYKAGYDNINIVLNRKKVEEISCLIDNKNPDFDKIWEENKSVIVNEDEIAFFAVDRGDGRTIMIEDVEKHINEADKQIEIEYIRPSSGYDMDFEEKMQAIIIPADNSLGYTIKSIEIKGIFTEEQLKEIARGLKVPEDLDVEIEEGEKYYWDAGERYLVPISVSYEGKHVAGATVDCETGEPIKNIWSFGEEHLLE